MKEKRKIAILVAMLLIAPVIGITSIHAETSSPEVGWLAYSLNSASDACDYNTNTWVSSAYTDYRNVMTTHNAIVGYDTVMYASELADSSRASWGDDTASLNVDENDITVINTHGGARWYDPSNPSRGIFQWDDSWDGTWEQDAYSVYQTHFLIGNESGNGRTGDNQCRTWGADMLLGDGDVEFVHAIACQSVQWPAIFDSSVFVGIHHRLHQYHGFHGAATLSTIYHMDDMAEDGWDGSLAWSWIDNMYLPNSGPSCPMALVLGDDQADTYNRVDTEGYDYPNVEDDPDSTPYKKLLYVSGCNPQYGLPLP